MKHACLKTAHKSASDHDFDRQRTTRRAVGGVWWRRNSCPWPCGARLGVHRV